MMGKKFILRLYLPVILFFTACSSSRTVGTTDDGKISVQFLQVNDVYEIAPIEGGKAGGLARVATVKQELLNQNDNTFMVMAGDFLSPSVYNSLKYEGQRIRGKQMVETLNAAGMDFVAFGNHEFDITESELQDRINESDFQWISSNSFHQETDLVKPFEKERKNGIKEAIPEKFILNVQDKDGTKARIGFIAINISSNKAPYVVYTNAIPTATRLYNQLKDSCDAVVAITHQLLQDDIELAKALPKLAAIIGGHEHDMRYAKVGDVVISKAHANARSVYIVKVDINQRKNEVHSTATLKMIDQNIPDDPATKDVVEKWKKIASDNYASIGFDANKVIMQNGEPLNGRESLIRREPTNFSKLIIRAMEEASPGTDLAILNTGSIRLDDLLYPPITQYDILRSLPFGGGIPIAAMKGSVLKKTLDAGRKNIGIGGFLVYSDVVSYDATTAQWLINKQPIPDEKIYKVALSDFLLTGAEENLGFLTKSNPGIIDIIPPPASITDPRSDIRLTIIKYMQRLKP